MKTPSTTEAEMRLESAPRPQTIEELTEYIESLTSMKHTYGTCVYAMSLAAAATFNYVAGKENCTGFQASCADLDFLRRSRHIEGPFMIVNFEDDLYAEGRTIGKVRESITKNLPWLSQKATEKLRTSTGMCRSVFARMLQLATYSHKNKEDVDPAFVPASKEEKEKWIANLEFLTLLESKGRYPSMEFVEAHIEDYKKLGATYVWIEPTDIAKFDTCEHGGMFRCGKSVMLDFKRVIDGLEVIWSFSCEEENSDGTPGLKIKAFELEKLSANAKTEVSKVIDAYLADVVPL